MKFSNCFNLVPLFALVLVFSAPSEVSAREPSQPFVNDRIGTALDACLSSSSGSATTLSLSACYQTAQTRYQTALDAAYSTALKHLDAVSAAKLRRSQVTWVAFRKDALALTQAPWTGDRGTIVGSEIAQSQILALKARILEIDLVWPGFALGDEPLEIGSGAAK